EDGIRDKLVTGVQTCALPIFGRLCLETLKRVTQTTEPRLLDERGRPKFDLTFYAVNKRGEFGAASFYPHQFAAHDGTEAKLRDRSEERRVGKEGSCRSHPTRK